MGATKRKSDSSVELVLPLREASRRLVRELGFLRPTLANSGYGPSAVHAILEIGKTPGVQARDLATTLRLDKSSMSRQLTKLESAGLVRREPASDDARSYYLFLTDVGQSLRNQIDRYASAQAKEALRQLKTADQQALVRSLSLYVEALNQNGETSPRSDEKIDEWIQEGYVPGCIGDIASLHGRSYAHGWGFGIFFEKRVATELAEFAAMLPAPGKGLWLYVKEGRTLASIAIDGNDDDSHVAHLRWFIVHETLRGMGIGRHLLARALEFADEHFNETYLWTFKGLDTARHLYESFGFQLTQELLGSQWGSTVVEQRFDRRVHRA